MPEIVLTEDQLRVLNEAETHVVVKSLNGDTIGTLDTAEAAMIAKARERMANRADDGIPSEIVLGMLRQLQEEDDRCGGLDLEAAEAHWSKIKVGALGNG